MEDKKAEKALVLRRGSEQCHIYLLVNQIWDDQKKKKPEIKDGRGERQILLLKTNRAKTEIFFLSRSMEYLSAPNTRETHESQRVRFSRINATLSLSPPTLFSFGKAENGTQGLMCVRFAFYYGAVYQPAAFVLIQI